LRYSSAAAGNDARLRHFSGKSAARMYGAPRLNEVIKTAADVRGKEKP
jgi:hypothetical protein